MWSFCIFDYKKKKIFLSRDNFGEKPLYYYFDGNNLIFGSEIKYLNEILSKKIPKKINYNKVYDYLAKVTNLYLKIMKLFIKELNN